MGLSGLLQVGSGGARVNALGMGVLNTMAAHEMPEITTQEVEIRTMRKITSMFWAACICVALVGCGGDSMKDAATDVKDAAGKVEDGAAAAGGTVPGAEVVEDGAGKVKDAAAAVADEPAEDEK